MGEVAAAGHGCDGEVIQPGITRQNVRKIGTFAGFQDLLAKHGPSHGAVAKVGQKSVCRLM